MDVPPVKYARTEDGYRIAYSEMGSGYPVVGLPTPPWGHAQLGWDIFPDYRRIAEQVRFVVYDSRGVGLSQRPVTDFSLEGQLRDFESVREKADVSRCALLATGVAVPIAIEIAARWPALISHLVLADGFLVHPNPPLFKVTEMMADQDWNVFTEYVGRVAFGYGDHAPIRVLEWLRASCDAPTWKMAWAAIRTWNVEHIASLVKAQTLVLQTRSKNSWVTEQSGSELAAAIPGARLIVRDDPSWRIVATLLLEFISGETTTAADHGADAEAAGKPDEGVALLSDRELEVLRHLASGKTNAQIAEALYLSPHTVVRHVSNILSKIGVTNRAEATAWAIRHGLVS